MFTVFSHWARTVVGHHQDMSVRPGPVDDVPDGSIDLGEILERVVANLRCLLTGVPLGPFDEVLVVQVLETVDALEDRVDDVHVDRVEHG